MPSAVRLRGLAKRYGAVQAVAGVDLDVVRGSFFGLVGPNGAGKSTLLGMVTGLVRPDQGSAEVAGADVWADPVAAHRLMGVLPEGLRLFDRLSGPELLSFAGRLRALPEEETARRADALLDVLGLREAGNRLVVDYSTGMRKKIGIAAALLHNPPVLFLDEPFESVDPVSARTVREVLVAYVGRGGTVVMSSHVMDLVQRLCDEVVILVAGRVVAGGRVDDLPAGRTLEDVFVDVAGGPGGNAARDQALGWLGSP